jgi:hypothetical protein
MRSGFNREHRHVEGSKRQQGKQETYRTAQGQGKPASNPFARKKI